MVRVCSQQHRQQSNHWNDVLGLGRLVLMAMKWSVVDSSACGLAYAYANSAANSPFDWIWCVQPLKNQLISDIDQLQRFSKVSLHSITEMWHVSIIEFRYLHQLAKSCRVVTSDMFVPLGGQEPRAYRALVWCIP